MHEAGRVGTTVKRTVHVLSEQESPIKFQTNSPLPLFPLMLFLDPLIFQRNVKSKFLNVRCSYIEIFYVKKFKIKKTHKNSVRIKQNISAGH